MTKPRSAKRTVKAWAVIGKRHGNVRPSRLLCDARRDIIALHHSFAAVTPKGQKQTGEEVSNIRGFKPIKPAGHRRAQKAVAAVLAENGVAYTQRLIERISSAVFTAYNTRPKSRKP